MGYSLHRQGMATPLVLTIVLALAALGGATYFASQNRSESQLQVTPAPTSTPAPASETGDAPTQAPSTSDDSFKPTGAVFAGSTTPYVDFSQADYDQALRENRVVLLYFYANWCPICRVELSRLRAAFDELELPNVVGFQVSYNDNETSDAEEHLARQFGIAYQHTKVILKNGQQILKNGSTWSKDRYVEELTNAAQ